MKFSTILATVMFLSLAINVTVSVDEYRRVRRTMGAGSNFINCLAFGNSTQRICSYDLNLITAIEQQQHNGSRPCPEGKVFYHHCNACTCGHGGAFECTNDLCGEDFFHTNGLPRYW
uniref:Pacifastin domain-containing protein n=1 Tax=Anopheles funestus TaxID=62324 RepID=A0A4Y0BKR5_ANOFN